MRSEVDVLKLPKSLPFRPRVIERRTTPPGHPLGGVSRVWERESEDNAIFSSVVSVPRAQRCSTAPPSPKRKGSREGRRWPLAPRRTKADRGLPVLVIKAFPFQTLVPARRIRSGPPTRPIFWFNANRVRLGPPPFQRMLLTGKRLACVNEAVFGPDPQDNPSTYPVNARVLRSATLSTEIWSGPAERTRPRRAFKAFENNADYLNLFADGCYLILGVPASTETLDQVGD
ncbi:hypothetical protein C8F04DRAFT_1197949 [Mycena alexandri]|uniref:Uncharacterized protein n=1 Tax=Mycena alexandri TaxID=1745969 RepID=A0AAD6S1E4_9AGAR|nr:hypothetical protein C8F04DRAFT_1197949 [Mycena alexandri]